MTNDEILKQEFLDQLTTVEKKHYEVTNHATWGKKHDEVVVSPRTPKRAVIATALKLKNIWQTKQNCLAQFVFPLCFTTQTS